MSGVNRVTLLGHLGKDPEIRYMPDGSSVANASLATSEAWKDKKTGDKQERTEWHNLVFFGKLSDIAKSYLKKGSKVYIEGKLKTDKYDKDCITRYTTKIIVQNVQLLDSRGIANNTGQDNAKSAYSQAVDDEYFNEDNDIPF